MTEKMEKLKKKTNDRIEEIIDAAYTIGFDEGVVSQQGVINDLITEKELADTKLSGIKKLISNMDME